MSCNQDFLDSTNGVIELNGIRYYPANKVEPILNSQQQLKAEIAAIVERLQRAYAMRESPDVLYCISKLRQLSAV